MAGPARGRRTAATDRPVRAFEALDGGVFFCTKSAAKGTILNGEKPYIVTNFGVIFGVYASSALVGWAWTNSNRLSAL